MEENTWRASCGCLCSTIHQPEIGAHFALIIESRCENENHQRNCLLSDKPKKESDDGD